MDPFTIQLLVGLTLLSVSIVVGAIRYFLKKRLDKIDTMDKDLTHLHSEFNSLQQKFYFLEEKLNLLENTNFPILMDIKNDISEMNKKLSVVETEIMYLKKHSDRHSTRLDSIDMHYHTHKRIDD